MISRNNNLNLIRLFAALQVVYMHAASPVWLKLQTPDWLTTALFAAPGVPIFFVVSGFLVSDSYLNSSTAIDFAKKRVLRIYPALIANILIIDLLIYLTGGFASPIDFLRYAKFLAVSLSTASIDWGHYLIGGPYVSIGFFPKNPWGILWTLTVELSFYLLLPLLLEIWRRSKPAGSVCLAGLAAGSLLLSQHFNVSNHFQPIVSITVAPYFWIFAIGIAARLWWSRLQHLFEGKALAWIAVHVVVVGIAVPFRQYPGLVNFQSPDALDVLSILSLAALTLSVAFTWPRPNLLRGCDFSYGIYLNHMLILETLLAFGYVVNAQYWLLAIGGAVGAGAASWFLIERPALKHKPAQVYNPVTALPAALPGK